eukprot:744898-Pelagomonas_calceolata.AAC.5
MVHGCCCCGLSKDEETKLKTITSYFESFLSICKVGFEEYLPSAQQACLSGMCCAACVRSAPPPPSTFHR